MPPRLWAYDRPLREVRLCRDDGTEVLVLAGVSGAEATYSIGAVTALYCRTADGAHAGLRADSADGGVTLVVFRTAAEPDTLDGLAATER